MRDMWALLVRKTWEKSWLQFQIMRLREQIPREVEAWRGGITWKHEAGTAVRVDPAFPPPESDPELEQVQIAIWRKELAKCQEEDLERQRKQEDIAQGKEGARQITRPGMLTEKAIWDELVRLKEQYTWPEENRVRERRERLHAELRRRQHLRQEKWQREGFRRPTIEEMEEERSELKRWLTKYRNKVEDALGKRHGLDSVEKRIQWAKEEQEDSKRMEGLQRKEFEKARLIEEERRAQVRRREICVPAPAIGCCAEAPLSAHVRVVH
jgi:hypothetical protein